MTLYITGKRLWMRYRVQPDGSLTDGRVFLEASSEHERISHQTENSRSEELIVFCIIALHSLWFKDLLARTSFRKVVG